MATLQLGFSKSIPLTDIVKGACEEFTKKAGFPKRLIMQSGKFQLELSTGGTDRIYDRFVLTTTEVDTAKLQDSLDSDYEKCSVLQTEKGAELKYPDVSITPNREEAEKILNVCGKIIPFLSVWIVTGSGFEEEELSLEKFFQLMIDENASDIHLEVNEPPVYRVDNDIMHSDIYGRLSGFQIEYLLKEIASPEEWELFQKEKSISFNFHMVGMGYSRVSAFYKKGAVHLTFRYLPEKIPSFEDLNLPRDRLERISDEYMGLYLIAGVTGSGKTTTMAAILDAINENRKTHILTIEDPIEYVYEDKLAMVSQREIGRDVPDFQHGILSALRQDPDVIVLGEMRERDTIRAAIEAASTGHLVFATVHLQTVAESISRITSHFDPSERDLLRMQLRDSLRGVICQKLVPKIGGGRVPALEILVNDHKEITDGILEGNTERISIGVQQENFTHSVSFERYFYHLVKNKTITEETAMKYAPAPSRLHQMLIGTYKIPRPEGLREAAKRGGGH